MFLFKRSLFWGDMLISRQNINKTIPPTPKKIPRDSGHKHGQSKIWKLQPAVGVVELADSPSPFRNPWEKNVLKPSWNTFQTSEADKRTVVSRIFEGQTNPWHFPCIHDYFLHLIFVKEEGGGKLGSESKTLHKLNYSKIRKKWWRWVSFGGVWLDSKHRRERNSCHHPSSHHPLRPVDVDPRANI